MLLTDFSVELKLFAITGWIGYFVLGYYLVELRVRTSKLLFLWLTGFLLTIVCTYAVTALIGGHSSLFFLDYLSAPVFLAASSLFMLLRKFSPSNLEIRFPRSSKLIHFIGCNTLVIYLLHVMVLESIQKGYFGLHVSVNTMNPIVEIPLITVFTLFICLGIIFVLKRVPVVKKLIG